MPCFPIGTMLYTQTSVLCDTISLPLITIMSLSKLYIEHILHWLIIEDHVIHCVLHAMGSPIVFCMLDVFRLLTLWSLYDKLFVKAKEREGVGPL